MGSFYITSLPQICLHSIWYRDAGVIVRVIGHAECCGTQRHRNVFVENSTSIALLCHVVVLLMLQPDAEA